MKIENFLILRDELAVDLKPFLHMMDAQDYMLDYVAREQTERIMIATLGLKISKNG